MKIYREFVRGSLLVSKGRAPTDDEVADCMNSNAEKKFQSYQVENLAPWMELFLKNYEAYNRKKRAQAGAAKRWKKKV
jgi:isopentenyldiphosphate isomerase